MTIFNRKGRKEGTEDPKPDYSYFRIWELCAESLRTLRLIYVDYKTASSRS
jgi:hypothetical protein